MILHAELFAPLRFATGPLLEVTFFRMNNTGITLCQRLKAGVAVSLVEAFLCLSAAMHAMDLTIEYQRQLLAKQWVGRHFLIAKPDPIGHRILQPAAHLSQRAFT
jgi:hypothetical protein